MGVYHSFLYGQQKDSNLIANQPRTIRSDEWVVNTQMTVAQKANDYQVKNSNIGDGQNMSIILDVPYKEWSQIFRPQNWSFFVMPFDNAFALKWWLLGYLLIISCYFFVLSMLPDKKILASLLSIGLFFSPFVQWWYQYITIGPLYYSFMTMTLITYLFRVHKRWQSWLIGAGISYLLVCFALVLYPPFQVPCALVIAAFTLGILLEKHKVIERHELLKRLAILFVAGVMAGACSLVFLNTRSDAVDATMNTAYPGKRITKSGGYDPVHLFSGNMDYQLNFNEVASHYQLPANGLTNQSENSSFLFIWPFIIVPFLLIMARDIKQRKVSDWPLYTSFGLLLVLILWLFVPYLPLIGNLMVLERVPHNRLILGLGLINMVILVLFMRQAVQIRRWFSPARAFVYALGVFAFCLAIDLITHHRFPEYIGNLRLLAFAVPLPCIVYAILRNRLKLAALGFAAFCVFMTAHTNPLYRGTAAVMPPELQSAITETSRGHPEGKWVIENGYLENFAIMSGSPSLSGLYAYPQLHLWRSVDDKQKTQEALYNRYAHVSINLDRTDTIDVPTKFIMPTFDHFGIATEPCSGYLDKVNVRFALTEVPLSTGDTCAHLLKTVRYPALTFYLYEIN